MNGKKLHLTHLPYTGIEEGDTSPMGLHQGWPCTKPKHKAKCPLVPSLAAFQHMQYILTANGDFPPLVWCKQILNDDTGQYPSSSLDKSDYTYWIQIQRDKQEVGLCVWDRHVTQRS